MNDDQEEDQLKALKRLRELPRGTQEDARIAAIKNLLGEVEIFNTLKKLRWPRGVVCPRCRSANIIKKDAPIQSTDKRHYYECLNCKEEGTGSSEFDDLTDLPIKSFGALRQWILCWYLIGFCSVSKIAKALGLSPQEVIQMASLGAEITTLPEAEEKQALELREKKTKSAEKEKRTTEELEEYTRSASKAPLKPGYKSKK